MADTDGFLSRWSRRKVQVQQGLPVPPAPVAQPEAAPGLAPQHVPAPTAAALPIGSTGSIAAAQPAAAVAEAPLPPPPTLAEAQSLTPADDFSRFVGRGVDPQVKNTALKTLFSDPHFNVMDGLDTYIDDYNTPDPLPAGMLRKMVQSTMLGLFDDEPQPPAPPPRPDAPDGPEVPEVPAPAEAAAAVSCPEQQVADAASPTEPPPLHEDPAVRLQPNDDAGPAGDQPGPVEDPGRQH